jgi:transposase InsO family protein
MRLSASEKEEIILLVERSELGVNRTLKQLGIPKTRFYKWYTVYTEKGLAGLENKNPGSRRQWNSIPQEEKNLVVSVALEFTDLSPRELSCKLSDERKVFISESSVYRILKANGLITSPAHILLAAGNEFEKKTRFVHEMWQTDFTYFKILGWGWYYLSTILDDYSRYIIHWQLCETMKAEDVRTTIHHAVKKCRLGKGQKPVLLSDNGSCYVSDELKSYLSAIKIRSIHGRVGHPQTQGKIERYHRSMKNVVKLDNYYHPEQLEESIAAFVEYYNNERYHESLNNVTPADVYYGRQEEVLKDRERVKKASIKRRRQYFLQEKLLNLKTETLSSN